MHPVLHRTLKRTLSEGGGVPFWVPLSETGVPALFFADYNASYYWFNGRRYADETSLNAAWGCTKSGITRQTATPVEKDGAELLTNGTFDTDTTGWTGVNSGTLANVGAALEITGNGGNTPGASQLISPATAPGEAFRLTVTRTGGTIGTLAMAAPNANLSGSHASATASVGTPVSIYFGGVSPGQYVGARLNANPANGTSIVDTASVKKVMPLAGYAPGTASIVITTTTPAVASGNKVFYQLDDGSEHNRCRLVYAADGHVHFIVTYNNTAVADFDLGAVAVSTAISVGFGVTSGVFTVALNGIAATTVTGQNVPGMCFMRIARSFTGETYDGTITSVALFAQFQSADALETATGSPVVAWGDSLTAGTGASTGAAAYPAVAATLFAPDRAISNKGVGSETSTQIAARQLAANRSLNARIAWIMASRNDIGTAIDTSANVAAMVSRVIGGKYLVGSILPSTADGNLSAGASVDRLARNAALQATYGARYVDLLVALQAAGDGSANDNSDIANGWVPRSLRSDAVHLNDAGYAIVAQAFYATTIAASW